VDFLTSGEGYFRYTCCHTASFLSYSNTADKRQGYGQTLVQGRTSVKRDEQERHSRAGHVAGLANRQEGGDLFF